MEYILPFGKRIDLGLSPKKTTERLRKILEDAMVKNTISMANIRDRNKTSYHNLLAVIEATTNQREIDAALARHSEEMDRLAAEAVSLDDNLVEVSRHVWVTYRELKEWANVQREKNTGQ